MRGVPTLFLTFLLLLFPGRRESRLEIPKSRPDDRSVVIDHRGYTTCFNRGTGIPEWVAYELRAEELTKNHSRYKQYFLDPMLPTDEQPAPFHYRNEGGRWVRGHMAPAGDMVWDDTAVLESNYMTNLCPQHHALNNGDWRRLEEKIRKLSKKKYPVMWIVCGAIVGENRNGRIGDRVVIPDTLFKALLARKEDDEYVAIGFLFPNDSVYHQLKEYAIPVDGIEERTGLDLFCRLKRKTQKKVEAAFDLRDWEL